MCGFVQPTQTQHLILQIGRPPRLLTSAFNVPDCSTLCHYRRLPKIIFLTNPAVNFPKVRTDILFFFQAAILDQLHPEKNEFYTFILQVAKNPTFQLEGVDTTDFLLRCFLEVCSGSSRDVSLVRHGLIWDLSCITHNR